jgi:halimadienyl-diphosphate synthase
MIKQSQPLASLSKPTINLTSILERIGQSDMLTTAYDTAWVARLREVDPELGLPAIEWLSQNQLPDGSWGAAQSYYYYDRVISTLSAMIALTYTGKRRSDKTLIEKGTLALENITDHATKGLNLSEKGPSIGFEMIVPTLVAEAEALGIIKQQRERILGRIGQQRAKKLELIKGKMVNRYITVAFSAEMAGVDGQHMLDIENLQEKNGSVGCSPSATSYFALQVNKGDQKALQYLHKIRGNNGGVPNVAPFDVFETAWSLWNFSLIPGYTGQKDEVEKHLKFLSNVWDANQGTGFASEYTVIDSDDSALVFDTLSRFGINKDFQRILTFEDKEYFRCFDLENAPSVSVNIHVLGALKEAGYRIDHPPVSKVLRYLEKTKTREGFWGDKWHLSPYYTTSHAIINCAGYKNELVRDAVIWIIRSQNDDGGWGVFSPTAEETAYALQALWIWKQEGQFVPEECLRRGKAWLEEHQREYSPLWIGKCLYSPRLVVDSAILSALAMVNL